MNVKKHKVPLGGSVQGSSYKRSHVFSSKSIQYLDVSLLILEDTVHAMTIWQKKFIQYHVNPW